MKKQQLEINSIQFNSSNPNPNDTSLQAIMANVKSEGWNENKGILLVEKVGDDYITLQGNNRLTFLKKLEANGILKDVTGKSKVVCNVVENLTDAERTAYVYDVSASKRIEEYYCLAEICEKAKNASSSVDLAMSARGAFEALLTPQSGVKFKDALECILNGDIEGKSEILLGLTRGWTQKAQYVFCGSPRLKSMQWDSSYPSEDAETPDTMLNLGRPKCKLLADAYKKDGDCEGENFNRIWAELSKPVVKKYVERFVDKKHFATLVGAVVDPTVKAALELLLVQEGQKSESNVGEAIKLLNANVAVEEAEETINMVAELDEATKAKLDAIG